MTCFSSDTYLKRSSTQKLNFHSSVSTFGIFRGEGERVLRFKKKTELVVWALCMQAKDSSSNKSWIQMYNMVYGHIYWWVSLFSRLGSGRWKYWRHRTWGTHFPFCTQEMCHPIFWETSLCGREVPALWYTEEIWIEHTKVFWDRLCGGDLEWKISF